MMKREIRTIKMLSDSKPQKNLPWEAMEANFHAIQAG